MKMIRISCVLLLVAVVMGAFGAHALRDRLNPTALAAWQTAVQYQFIHGLGIILLSVVPTSFIQNAKRLELAHVIMIAGIGLFSGSIYLLSTKELHGLTVSWLGPLTPIGGLCFILAWALAFFSIKRKIAG